MKHRLRKYLVICGFVIAALAGGCGVVGKDSPGVKVSVIITPTYNGVNTPSVDAVQNNCTDGSKTQAEYFADHTATASISAMLINPSNVVQQMTIFIDGYTVDYASSADSPGAPLIQSDTRQKTMSFIVSSATVTSLGDVTVELVDLIRKNKYHNDAPTGLNNYTATYTFVGHSENGVSFSFTSQTDFQIGSFNYCPSGFQPI